MKWQYIAIAFAVIVLLLASLYMFTGTNNWTVGDTTIGSIRHSVILRFVDGTTTEMENPLSILYKDKPIESIDYSISGESYESGSIDLTGYTPTFVTPLGSYAPDISSEEITANDFNLRYTVSMWKLVNYTLEDGTYLITLHPDGMVKFNEQITSLPDVISFSLRIEDDRYIYLEFGP